MYRSKCDGIECDEEYIDNLQEHMQKDLKTL